MPIVFSFLAAFSLVPLVGFTLGYFGFYNYPFYQISFNDLLMRVAFFAVFWMALLLSYKAIRVRILQADLKSNLGLCYVSRKRFYRILVPLSLCVCFVFVSTGYEFLVQGVGSGDLRTSHGLAGPFYRLTIGFLIPALSCLIACLYFFQEKKSLKLRFFVFVYFLLLCLAMISTGYKSTVIFFFGPFVTVYFMYKGGFSKFVLFCFIFMLVIILATMLVRNIGLYSAFMFIIHRIFYMSAYGDVGFLSVKNDVDLHGAYFFTNLFGRHIYELVFYASDRLHYINSNLSILISYMVYPDVESVLSGKTNLTVTNYSESLFIFGKAFLAYGLLLGCYVGFLCGILTRLFSRGQWLLFSLLISYIFSVVLPWMNSGSFLNLFSLFSFIYMFLSYICLRFFLRLRINWTHSHH
ncbi:MAG: oligosaccharide repeat unit polymerase [Oleiphilaceae bacterium]|jgi:oligosaccharide repeat unit polymerase